MTRKSRILTWVLTIILIGGAAVFLWKTDFFLYAHSVPGIKDYVERFSPYSQTVFFLLQLTSVLLAPIPSNLTAAAGALVFGTGKAFFLTWAAVVLGSCIVFRLSRLWGGDFARRFITPKMSEKYLHLLVQKQDIFLSLVFLFPFFPDDLICILAGLTDIKAPRFLAIVVLFRPWGLLAACGLGGSALAIPPWAMIAIGVIGVAALLLGLRFGDRIEAFFLSRLKDNRPS